MNTKTTLYLSVVLIVLGSAYVIVQSRPAPTETEASPTPSFSSSVATRDLIEDKLGDVVKVVCRRKGREEWVFEKETKDDAVGQVGWRMTSPMDTKCLTWEVNKFGTRLGSLQYEISYQPGATGAGSASAAGLDPPEATVTLTDAAGKSVTVEIGKSPSRMETYVRLAGSDEIVIGKSNLRDLFKDRALDYRDKQVFSFKADDVTRVEITESGDADAPVEYVYVKDGSRWMMQSPVTARATSKVDDMIRAISALRVSEWQDDDSAKHAIYGLEHAALAVRVTVEEEVPVEDDDEESTTGEGESTDEPDEVAETPTKTEVTVYELLLSDRSPIGEDTKTYVRVVGEDAVAVLLKSTADKFKPVMSEWRDMRLTPANVSAATRIELQTPQGSATLVRNDEGWSFEPDGGRAEDSVVSELLTAVGDVSAVVFLDDAADSASLGLAQPQAEIRLTIPGVEGVERIAIGAYADEKTKRLVYGRRNEGPAVAKIRTGDVAKLLQGPQTYRDRTIVDVLPSRFERITLSSENAFVGGRTEITLARAGNDWSMSAPTAADIRTELLDGLVTSLGGLRAERVVADESQTSAFGLHAPTVTLVLTYKALGETGVGEAGDDDQADEPVEETPRTIELAVTEHDGKYYAKRADRPAVYEVTKGFYEQLRAEYRTDRVIDFDDSKVLRFSIRKGDTSHGFAKQDGRWIYEAEPDLPLDSDKVLNLLLQVRDLRTARYVRHTDADLKQHGLADPANEVVVSLEDGSERVLWVSDQVGQAGAERGYFANVKGRSDVFLLTDDSLKRLAVSLEKLEARP